VWATGYNVTDELPVLLLREKKEIDLNVRWEISFRIISSTSSSSSSAAAADETSA
jgi:hypothetical protein